MALTSVREDECGSLSDIEQFPSSPPRSPDDCFGCEICEESDPLPVENEKINVIQLTRGGIYVPTLAGPLQIGIPPETIKDSLALGLPMPQYYVMPPDSFHRELGSGLGINVAEFEFPAYYNFFLRKRTIKLVVASMEIERRLRIVLQETLFGPVKIDPYLDFKPSYPMEARPDLSAETQYFAVFDGELLTLDSLVTFLHFDKEGKTVIPGTNDESGAFIEIRHSRFNGGEFIIDEVNRMNGYRRRAVVSQFIDLPEVLPFHPAPTSSVFEPPSFGVTVLGNSHGFDPQGTTSGYVLWINRRGYMIDPPPYASVILRNFNIRPSLIDGVIVTHCHADHDAGAFQKILFEGQVTVITTRSIYGSFIRKYCALSGLPSKLLRQTHRFLPVTIGETLRLRGASLNFFYSLHSIPCIGLEVYFGPKSIVFSADHMNDPDKIKQMKEVGILSEGRCESLLNFPWHHDAIFHEAGVPPIHTPIKTLMELPDDIKKKLYVVHVSPSSIPADSGLKIAPLGVESTVVLDIEAPPTKHISDSAVDALDLIGSVGIFGHCSLTQARDLLELGIRKTYKSGSTIQESGATVTEVCIIASGRATVKINAPSKVAPSPRNHKSPNRGDLESQRRRSWFDEWGTYAGSEDILTRGDWFGEEALMDLATPAAASVAAISDVELLVLSATDLRWVIGDKAGLFIGSKGCSVWENDVRGSLDIGVDNEDKRKIIGRSAARRPRIDSLIARNCILRSMSRGQKLLFQSLLEPRDLDAGDIVWQRGEVMTFIVLIARGTLHFSDLSMNEVIMDAAMDRAQENKVLDGVVNLKGSGTCSCKSKVKRQKSKDASNGIASMHRMGFMADGESRRRVRCPLEFKPGTLIGRSGAMINAESGSYLFTLRCKTNVTLLVLERDRMHYFSIYNPGVFLSLHDLVFIA
mmetsp:Transcript_20151/g.29778  ORF Transcript_20151/g.29778 Transcript_20151/m.29778 type:complete len:921 (-) Transcript_20151:256-3018(-)|eukprot:CAMPEP_0171456552 /NCGR_PEP_ID=MMETSP0945-20130129/2989_1 /TAXON_ID=109269 /ORGANISM="Vaucheria litorea, Strain CCMP2940" /LENGTH=920 /DNA_ID=CAMNT_0011981991 /DNA_START=213 /DNA_END=2975 /DNA_ORIENTATION=+